MTAHHDVVAGTGAVVRKFEGFRMPAVDDDGAGSGGGRPKPWIGRNRDGGTWIGAGGSMGILMRRLWGLWVGKQADAMD